MSLKEFRIHVAIALSGKENTKVGRKPNKNNQMEHDVQKIRRTVILRPISDIKFEEFDPTRVSKGRCHRCKKDQTDYIYTKCDTRLYTLKKETFST